MPIHHQPRNPYLNIGKEGGREGGREGERGRWQIDAHLYIVPIWHPHPPPPSLPPSLPPLGWCMNFVAMAALAAVGTPSITSLLPLVGREGGKEGGREGGRVGGWLWLR